MFEKIFNKNKIIYINVILLVSNIIFLLLLQPKNTIISNIVFAISLLFIENLLLSVCTIILYITRKELIATKSKQQRELLSTLSKLTFNNELYFEFIPNIKEMAQIKEFKQVFSESDKVDTLVSKYLKDYVLIDTVKFMKDLSEISNNQDFIKNSAIIDASYSQENFEQSRYKLEIIQQNYDEKMKIFLENSDFTIRINFKELVINYPNYVEEMKTVYNENKDLLDNYSNKELKYNSEFKEFFDIIFLNFDNDKKEEGFLAFKKIVEKLSKNSIQSKEEFNQNINKIKGSIF